MYKKILVPLDGSHRSEKILPHVDDPFTGVELIDGAGATKRVASLNGIQKRFALMLNTSSTLIKDARPVESHLVESPLHLLKLLQDSPKRS